jgi:MFS transporter, DHA2 family, multidrug resistance protein
MRASSPRRATRQTEFLTATHLKMTDGLPNPQRFFAFIAIAIAITMAVLDTAIVNVALPVIAADLHASPADSVWVINAYQLAITVSLLPLASLGDILGYKRVYWSGLAVFTVASLACAGAQTLPLLCFARVVQGLGAAGIMSVNIALVRFIYPKAQLGVGVGYASLVVAATSVAGPSIASVILAFARWPWLFLVNVPLGVLALLIGARTLPLSPASGNRFNVRSAALNAVAFGLLISGLTAISEPATSRRGATMVLGGVVAGAAFVWRERRLRAPMLPIDLLRLPVFALSLVTSICSFAAQTMAGVALPFYFEQTLGRTETQTGLLMTPWPLMTALVAPIAGRLSDRFAPQKLGSLGLALLATGLASLAWLGEAPSTFDICWRLAICGIGFGMFQSPNNRVIMGSAPRERSGGASGLQSMGRLLGQSLGAVAVTVAFSLVHGRNTSVLMACAAGLGVVGACASGLRRTHATA